MAIEVIMPKAGSEMEEGEIVQWFKNEGDEVKEGEVLLEIVTDKVNMEVEAEASGTLLKIVHPAGAVVPVVETIAWIGQAGETVPGGADSTTAAAQEVVAQVASDVKVPTTSATEVAPARERKGEFDVAVIGGGPAGYVAAIKAAQLGGKVALVESRELGGTCLNRGCIPTKTFLHNAEIINHIKSAKDRGINLVNEAFSVDMKKTVEVKNKVAKTLSGGVAGLLRSYGVKVYKGIGRLTADKKILVDGKDLIDADKVILAGGSKVSRINIPGMDNEKVLTSDEILDITELPKHLVVIGGGVIGSELGQAFATFGSKVTIIEMADRLIANMDKDASAILEKTLKKQGVNILTSSKLLEIQDKGQDLVVKVEGKEDIVADRVLLSIGRVPDNESLGELADKFEMDRGRVKVNDFMETSVEGIYAPGDINGVKMLAHAAFKMGEIAAENAMGHRKKLDLKSTPAAIYTHPEIAMVGLTEEQAKEKYDIKIGKFNFGANGRSLASNQGEGFVKVIMDTKYHEILGIHIAGPVAAELINEGSMLIQTELTVDDVMDVIHGHPTYSEALYEAIADCIDMCIHAPKKK
ncbi:MULTISPECIES: dihydrolipoyl dehydrogenase [unclassified Gemella]|uniref:dihydrolipoyl dehydrogenase n=1 Tax=unclassified Gemella TaxID=2624949 RepID=UPI0015D0722D|nr:MULTISPECIES: dihydrolipoyl dehydrogenase [unclassified Gemella]MBF0710297.1 dihydrolipoyl dehydrogenase [Gemella sp. GL1.1]NYS27641.1 dihydrolipoyl dehydrogenase [Gemella sp. GL1]